MKYALLVFSMSLFTSSQVLFDFNIDSSLSEWTIVNDGVMGGISKSEMIINKDGNAQFSGSVSLDYNGGFASVRYNPNKIDVSSAEAIVIRCKGVPNRYQIRTKSSSKERHSYIQYINVTEEWQEIEIAMKEMYPQFRGYELDMPNYPKIDLEEFAILIANKRYEDFQLEIDWIRLK